MVEASPSLARSQDGYNLGADSVLSLSGQAVVRYLVDPIECQTAQDSSRYTQGPEIVTVLES